MIVYRYDNDENEYIGKYECQKDPIDGGFLIPAKATEIKPPKTKENEVAVFNGKKWEVKPDFRGTKYWIDKQTEIVIKEIGVVVPEDSYFDYDSIPLSLEEQKESVRNKRNDTLIYLDEVVTNPLRWQDFSKEEQSIIQKYRKELLDVPQHPDFPNNEFPETPDILKDLIKV